MNDLVLYVGLLFGVAVTVTFAVVMLRTGRLGAPKNSPTSAETGQLGDSGERSSPVKPRLAVVVNPTKFDDVQAVRQQVTAVTARFGWADPLWLETTIDDPGTGQARKAMEQGVHIICALGGDGTVRSVAAALVGTDTALGLLPAGTGNLLARNLALPIDNLEDALTTVISGEDHAIDICTLQVVRPEDTQEQPKDYFFLVMAGIGFDAAVMLEAPERLKATVGWPAYIVSGLRNLNGPRFGVDIRFDEGQTIHRRVRSVMIGNVGKLQGGVALLPDAKVDDGVIDAVLISPRGIIGWAAVAARILTKTRKGHPRVEQHQCQQVELKLGHDEPVQLDGDPIGPCRHLFFTVAPGQLTVRLSSPPSAAVRGRASIRAGGAS